MVEGDTNSVISLLGPGKCQALRLRETQGRGKAWCLLALLMVWFYNPHLKDTRCLTIVLIAGQVDGRDEV